VASYIFFLVFQSRLPFPLSFLQKCVFEGSSYTRCDQYSQPSCYLLYVGYSPPPWLYVKLLHFQHDQSNWSPSSSSITCHNFPCISVILFKVSNFQHHTKLCSSSSTLQVFSLNLSPICWWKVFFLLNAAFDCGEYVLKICFTCDVINICCVVSKFCVQASFQ
jgi:hypothetical protein